MLGIPDTFSPEDVIMFLGDYALSDFADGTFIEIQKNSPNFQSVQGIRGKHTRKHLRDKSGTITIRILQTSSVNNVLSSIVEFDEINQTGKFTVTIKDVLGDSSYVFMNCYLQGYPSVSYAGNNTVAREWMINYEYTSQHYIGGNARSPLDILTG